MASVNDLGEFALVESLCRRLSDSVSTDVLVGPGDDAAVVSAGDDQFVMTADALIEGIHFRRDWMTAHQLGWKALAVNVSDVAAMLAEPRYALITLGLSGRESVEFVDGVYDGALELAAEFGVQLIGGDTVKSPAGTMLSVTVIGTVVDGDAVLRSGAQLGDAIVATGTFGDSGMGLEILQRPDFLKTHPHSMRYERLMHRHLQPMPRVREGLSARAAGTVHAAIDVSDGLTTDLGRIAASSVVGIEVQLSSVPLSEDGEQVAPRLRIKALDVALSGGEDYELLLAVTEGDVPAVCDAITSQTGTQTTVIGHVVEGPAGIWGRNVNDGRVELMGGYEHFTVAD